MKIKNVKRKTPDNSALVKKESKRMKWSDYSCIYTGSLKPINEVGIERLAEEIVCWARDDEEALKVTQFIFKKGISRAQWSKWCAKNPSLLEAHNTAKEIIGNRREIGALNRKFDPGTVNYTMPFYDSEWKAGLEWRASLKEKKDDTASGPQIVVMDRIPDSPLVPARDKDE